MTIKPLTPTLQENFKNPGAFVVTRTGSTAAPLRFFYGIADGHYDFKVNLTSPGTGTYFSGPLCQLNTVIPKGTVIGYVVTSQTAVDGSTRTDCATVRTPSNAPAGATAIRMPSQNPATGNAFDAATITQYRLALGEGLAQKIADQRPIDVAVLDVYNLASSARDFVPLAGEATFSIGERTTHINVIPSNDSAIENTDGSEPLTITLLKCPPLNPQPPTCVNRYALGDPSKATIDLVDGEALTAAAADPFAKYAAGGVDSGTLTIHRMGNSSGAQQLWLTVGGSAPKGTYSLSDGNGAALTPGKHFTYNVTALGMASGYISGPFYNPQQGPYDPDAQADAAAGDQADNPRNPDHPPDADDPQHNPPLMYLVANKDEVVYNDANGNPGCACQLPAHRIPIYMPDLPQVTGSSAGLENFGFNVKIGDAFRSGDVVATFDVPTIDVTVPAPAGPRSDSNTPTAAAVTVTPNSGAPAASTVAVTAMFVPLPAEQSGYLSGPLAGGNSPPSVGKAIAYLVPTPQDVLPASASTPPADGAPVKIPQFGDGVTDGLVTSFSLDKHIGDSVSANERIAVLQVPVSTAADGTDAEARTTQVTSPAAGFLSGPLATPVSAGNTIGYVVAAAGDALPADSSSVPSNATAISMPQVGSGFADYTISFLKNVGDSLAVGDTVATSVVPESADITAPVSGLFCPLNNLDPANPPAAGQNIGFINTNTNPSCTPPQGTPVTMADIGTASGGERSLVFLKDVRSGAGNVQSGDTIAKVMAPESATDAAEEGNMVYIANGAVSPVVDVIATQCGRATRLIAAGACGQPAISGQPTVSNNLVTITAWSMDLNRETPDHYDWTATDSNLLNQAVHPTAQSNAIYTPYSGSDPNPYPTNDQLPNKSLVIDPTNLTPGTHRVQVTVHMRNGDFTQATLALDVRTPADLAALIPDQDNDQDTSLPPHTDGDRDDIRDSDGDYIPDATEGYGDSDNDGIPDYLDSNFLPVNVLQEVRLNASAFLIVADPGLSLSLGDVAFAAGAGAAGVTFNDFSKYGTSGGAGLLNSDVPLSQECIANSSGTQAPGNPLPQDMRPPSCYPPYVFQDFDIGRIPARGGVAHVVIPQQYGLPVNPHYLVFHPGKGWQDFVDNHDKNNTIASCCDHLAANNAGNKGNYPGSVANCPPPGSSAYTAGLTEGYKCIELTIQDGGPNDTDGVANHTVTDPAVVASAPRTAAQIAAGGGELVPAGAGALAPVSLGGLLGLFYLAARIRRRALEPRRLNG